jgi:hypothetical protein
LELDEVSVVDRGAGRGVDIVLTKGVTEMSLQEQIAKSYGPLARGEITDFDIAILHQRRAEELKMSIGKYYETREGAKALRDALRCSYYKMQCDIANGNGHPQWNEVVKNRPHVEPDSGAKRAAKCEGLIKELMKSGMGYDQAVTVAHKRERNEAMMGTTEDEYDAQRINSGGWNASLGEQVNADAPEGQSRRPTGLGRHR